MLTAVQISALQDKLGQLLDPVIEFLIEDIARRVSEAGQLTGTAAYQTWQIQKLGVSQKKLKEEMAKRLKKSTAEVERLMKQAAKTGYNFDLSRLPTHRGIPFAANSSVQQIVDAAVKLAQDDLTNITQTMGFVGSDGVCRELTAAYNQACDVAHMKVATGAQDYISAVREATRNLAAKGIRTIDYESGVHTSLEAAVRRNMMGGLGLMQEQISQSNHDDLGCDGWEISAHAGSAPDHEPIQGKQYTDAEFQRINNSLVRRIGTLNCGHAAFPIILGVNGPQYTEEELEEFRQQNETGVNIDGRHYTIYEATQRQRKFERAIRGQKHKILIDKELGDDAKLQTDQIKLQRLKLEYSRFSKAADLPLQYERMEAAGFTWKDGKAAEKAYKTVANRADAVFSLGSTEENIAAYTKEKPIIDMLASHGVKYIKRIDGKEIIVDAGKPTIKSATVHAVENQQAKPDRLGMTVEKAQEFVEFAKLTIFQQERETLKFLAQEGYAVLNFDHQLVTAVPQKWRKKYDKYLQEVQK